MNVTISAEYLERLEKIAKYTEGCMQQIDELTAENYALKEEIKGNALLTKQVDEAVEQLATEVTLLRCKALKQASTVRNGMAALSASHVMANKVVAEKTKAVAFYERDVACMKTKVEELKEAVETKLDQLDSTKPPIGARKNDGLKLRQFLMGVTLFKGYVKANSDESDGIMNKWFTHVLTAKKETRALMDDVKFLRLLAETNASTQKDATVYFDHPDRRARDMKTADDRFKTSLYELKAIRGRERAILEDTLFMFNELMKLLD